MCFGYVFILFCKRCSLIYCIYWWMVPISCFILFFFFFFKRASWLTSIRATAMNINKSNVVLSRGCACSWDMLPYNLPMKKARCLPWWMIKLIFEAQFLWVGWITAYSLTLINSAHACASSLCLSHNADDINRLSIANNMAICWIFDQRPAQT